MKIVWIFEENQNWNDATIENLNKPITNSVKPQQQTWCWRESGMEDSIRTESLSKDQWNLKKKSGGERSVT